MTLAAVSPASARASAERGGAVLLDLRPPAAFAHAHAAGALSVPFSARGLAERVRIAIPPGVSVILVAPDEAIAAAAATQLGAASIDVRGVLGGGMDAWLTAALPVAAVAEVGVEELSRLGREVTVVDVREPLEWETGYVPGALRIPLGRLREEPPPAPRESRVVTICEAGVRSCSAASILASAGFTDVAHVPAGTSGYRQARLPLAFPAPEEVKG